MRAGRTGISFWSIHVEPTRRTDEFRRSDNSNLNHQLLMVMFIRFDQWSWSMIICWWITWKSVTLLWRIIKGRLVTVVSRQRTQPTTPGAGNSWKSTLGKSTCRGSAGVLECWSYLVCFSAGVLELARRLLSRVSRMSGRGPQPNSTSAADRNKVASPFFHPPNPFRFPGTDP